MCCIFHLYCIKLSNSPIGYQNYHMLNWAERKRWNKNYRFIYTQNHSIVRIHAETCPVGFPRSPKGKLKIVAPALIDTPF